jgi:hypothetical protein
MRLLCPHPGREGAGGDAREGAPPHSTAHTQHHSQAQSRAMQLRPIAPWPIAGIGGSLALTGLATLSPRTGPPSAATVVSVHPTTAANTRPTAPTCVAVLGGLGRAGKPALQISGFHASLWLLRHVEF